MDCPTCGTEMDEVTGMDCDRANYVCPECAPETIHEMATTVYEDDDEIPRNI